jgi:small subunit ribosomal protein S1
LEKEFEEALSGVELDQALEQTAVPAAAGPIEPETMRKGRVISVYRDSVFIDLGGRNQGVLSVRLFENPPEAGTAIDVMVHRYNPEDSLYQLTLPGGAITDADWSQLDEGMVVEARVTGHNKGGVECEVNHIRGFIPASQVSLYRIEDLSTLVGEKFA